MNHEKPLTWKAARSLFVNGKPRLVVGLRGPRRLDAATGLAFRYKSTGAGEVAVALGGAARTTFTPKVGEWSPVTLKFAPRQDATADAVIFTLPEKSELVIDDVLLYTPGG